MEPIFSLPKKLPEQDLLNEWLKTVRWQNHYLNPHPVIRVEDSKLQILHDHLQSFFGGVFFQTTAREIKHIPTEVRDDKWIFQLLANDDYPSLLRLFEVSYILQFVSSHDPHLEKVLKGNTENRAFRDYLFEALVFEMLSSNGIPVEPKPVINGKEKEGFLDLDGTKFLFECKKLYPYQLPGMRFIFTIHQEFFRLWNKNPVSLNGYISVSTYNDDLLSKNRNQFNEHFSEYFDQVKFNNNINFTREIFDRDKGLIGKIHFEPYNLAIFDYTVDLISDTAVCFRVLPPVLRTVEEEMKQFHNTHVVFKFSIAESVAAEFLIKNINRKRKSQRDFGNMPRIFFFDNEVLRGMEPALFQSEYSIPEDAIQNYLASKKTDDIICILFRKYHLVKQPVWKLKVYCRPELNHFKRLIESWKLLYDQPLFLKDLPIVPHR